MNHPIEHSSQRDNFLGAIALLVVTAIASALMGSFAGFVVIGALVGVLCTRAPWARIVTLVIVGYVGLVSLLVALFARGGSSVTGFLPVLIAAAIFWLLLRPGMDRYFSPNTSHAGSQVVPLAPLPGALPHLQQQRTATPVVPPTRSISPVGAGSTQEQWARLQQQLRAEQEKEQRETAAERETSESRPFPWLTMIFTVMVFAYASSVGGDLGKASMLLVIPGSVAAMLRWIEPRGFLLAVLILSGGLIVRPDWNTVGPELRALVQHHGPMVFAAIALLAYVVALCSSGLAGDCEEAA